MKKVTKKKITPTKKKTPTKRKTPSKSKRTTKKLKTIPPKVDVNKKYDEKTLKEHILLRPDTYIGGIDIIQIEEWAPPPNTKDIDGFSKYEKRIVKYCPAAMKIVDEIFVNARDASVRDVGVTQIKISVDKEKGKIKVWNNSTRGIPIEKLDKSGLYVPESIFGKLLTGENFDDTKAKISGGKNGLGSKVSNIYSTEFNVHVSDALNGLQFRQIYTNNMSEKTKPKITKYSGKTGFVEISFVPDFPRLGGMKGIDDDFYLMLMKRAYDLAACTRESVKIYFNAKMIKVRSMEKYMNYFLGPVKDTKRVFKKFKNTITPKEIENLQEECKDTQRKRQQQVKELQFDDIQPTDIVWEIGLAMADDKFTQTSFVNGIYTSQGGTHVNYIRDKVVRKISAYLKAKKKEVKTEYIRANLWVFINATVINPSFSGQTKSELTTVPKSFFYKCTIPDEFVEEFDRKCKILNAVISLSEAKANKDLTKDDGKKYKTIKGLPKLTDANHAGGDKSLECTLFLTEGDSAKTMAITGLRVLDPDYYGVFPLKGKLINPEGKKDAALLKNQEYINIKKIIGLQENVDYSKPENRNNLRYGKVILLTDQDVDGFHIKTLFVKLCKERFKGILGYEEFFQCFITPIVRADIPKKGKKEKQTKLFFNLAQFDAWKEEISTAELKKWTIKYLKGLGTSEPHEVVEYFSEFEKYRKVYINEDHTKTIEAIDLGLGKKFADDRKIWLSGYDSNNILDYSKPNFSFCDMIHKELKHYSYASIIRMIPSVCDGFKPSLRKIMWACIQRGLWEKKLKVPQISGLVSEKADYHHGEASLLNAIIGMAQNYSGSNNLNLLTPSGQFGSRLSNGNDASAARYLFSKLEPVVKTLFHSDDHPLIEYCQDENNKLIEPVFYVPVIPTVLLNGSTGIATAYSSDVPGCNPLDIIDRIRELLKLHDNEIEDHSLTKLSPWFRGFKGTVVDAGPKKFQVKGVWKKINNTSIKITELPVGYGSLSFEQYKEFLEASLLENKPKPKKSSNTKSEEVRKSTTKRKRNASSQYFIKSYISRTNDVWCDYTITYPSKAALDKAIEDGIETQLKLTTELKTSNMHLRDENNQVKLYSDFEEIIKTFYKIRLELYQKRKKYLLAKLKKKLNSISSKTKFIEMIVEKKLEVRNIPKAKVAAKLKELDFPTFEPENNYQYLLNIPIYGLTKEEVDKYKKLRQDKLDERNALKKQTPKELWAIDLVNLEVAIKAQNKEWKDKMALSAELSEKMKGKKKKTVKKRKNKK